MSLLRNFATVGGATLASRILGFARDVMIAAALGTGPVADAFVVAFRFPNLFRRLFAEGAFNSAFVPLFARTLEGEGEAAARAFAREAMGGLMTVLAVLIFLATLAMPVLMLGLAPGFSEDPDKFDLAVLLTRICLPYLLFVSLLALVSGALNGLGRFAAAAFAPTLLNVVFIVALGWMLTTDMPGTPQAGIVLSIAVILGGIAQLVMVLLAIRKAGMPLFPTRPRWDGRMKRLVALGVPGLIAGGITQINIVVGTMIASLQAGAVSLLYYADRVYQLPLGVVGIAIGVVLLPELSRRLKAGDEGAANHTQNRSLEFSMVLTLPAAVALAVVPEPILTVLFQRGAFSADAVAGTSAALAAFAAGLPAFVLVKVFSPGFFAREDTKTPMRIAGVTVAVNIAASLALFHVIGHVGIALATTLAGWVNALALFALLHRRGHFPLDPATLKRIALMALSALAMGAALYGLAGLLSPFFARQAGLGAQAGALTLLVLSGVIVFFGLCQVTGAANLKDIARQFRRRKAPAAPPSDLPPAA
ncbi:MAG: murein biosynthesis integral membrane protein MurJ [Hyphomicrobiaceae bacterium]|nr:murein biosynthesis integral membrane protein MurJ [Hyphomicrobiaceae bacterium]